jgi:hypothetical protein
MKAVGLAIVLVLGAAACGDNKTQPDAAMIHDGSTPGIDAAPPVSTFTTFVINLVENDTNATGTPVAYSTFSALTDPDATNNNTAAYAALFQ